MSDYVYYFPIGGCNFWWDSENQTRNWSWALWWRSKLESWRKQCEFMSLICFLLHFFPFWEKRKWMDFLKKMLNLVIQISCLHQCHVGYIVRFYSNDLFSFIHLFMLLLATNSISVSLFGAWQSWLAWSFCSISYIWRGEALGFYSRN